MPPLVPPLTVLCLIALAPFPDELNAANNRRIPAAPALLDVLAHSRDPRLWAVLAQLVYPLPPDLHDHDVPLTHPALPLLQKIPDSHHFSIVTLLSLPNCIHLRDDDVANFRTLHRLLALDLRGCSISSYALVALARGLVASDIYRPTRSGTWGLRLLSLHGCPNIDNNVLAALHKFPLLSAIDLRFTRCTPNAVNPHLSPLGFRPSDNNSLFHPAPLSLALCSLEKVALSASDPISLYSCPPQSVFRIYIDQLNYLPHPKKAIPASSSSASHSAIRTKSSAEDTVVFIPPLPKQTKNRSFPSSKPSLPSSVAPAVPTSPLINQPASNVSSFYENAPSWNRHSKKNVLPLSAQAVQSVQGAKLDPLAIARLPPPWKILDTCNSSASFNPLVTATRRQGVPGDVEDLQLVQPIACRSGQSLSNSLKVDRTRLHNRSSDAVADMVHQFTSKRPKIESEFALEKTRAKASIKSRNPFTKCVRSVFAESSMTLCNEARSTAHESPKEAEPDTQLRACRSLPSKVVGGTLKPLKPITSLKPPILPKELLPSLPQHTPRRRTDLLQTRLSFTREVE